MEIRVAKTAGFCFGVKRAVDLTYGLLNEGCKVATLGPLIHNPQTVEDLERRGAMVADTPADVPAGYEVVIRSHGVPRSIYDELEARGCVYHDATCPFVRKIQKIAAEADAAGAVYDGLQEALRQGDEVVFVDTAGRLQNKAGLMEELKKVVRVIKKVIPEAPQATLLTIDATTGQNALSQVAAFREMAAVSGLVVTKLDGSSKGGILVAVAEETGVPIHYIGVGEGIDDLDEFKAKDFARNLLGVEH